MEKVERLLEKLKKLYDCLDAGEKIIYEADTWITEFENSLSRALTRGVSRSFKPMRFGTDVGLYICDDGDVRFYMDSVPAEVDEVNVPLTSAAVQKSLRRLIGFRKFLDNIDEVVRQIDEKISELDNTNSKLREMLEEIKDALAPLVIAHEIKP